MTTTRDGHLDRRKVARQGYFDKSEDGMPHENYGKECKGGGRGYLGPRHEAHHILPDTSLEESARDSKKNTRYLEDVKWITDWNINAPDNLIGLPTFHSYEQYFQQKARLSGAGLSEAGQALVAWFNTFTLGTRQRWLSEFGTDSPEQHPIHNPVNWGHTDYNEQVAQDIQTQVWDPLNDKKKKHQLDAKNVAGALKALDTKYYNYLVKRGAGADMAKWKRRNDPTDNGWFKPFTMADVSNPLFT